MAIVLLKLLNSTHESSRIGLITTERITFKRISKVTSGYEEIVNKVEGGKKGARIEEGLTRETACDSAIKTTWPPLKSGDGWDFYEVVSRREAEMMHAVVRALYFHAISLYEGNDARNDRKTASRLQGFRYPVCLHIYI